MKSMSSSLFKLIVPLLVALSCSDNQNDFIRTSGTSLVTGDGAAFEIRGTNLGNWLNPEGYLFKFPKSANCPRDIDAGLCQLVGPGYMARFWQQFRNNYITEKDIEFIASTGATTVRLPFHYKLFTSETYLGSSDENLGFELVDNVVGWCGKHGLKLILDMHDCPGGQTGDNIDDSFGYPWLFVDEALQTKFINIWSRIARHYSDEPVILGYDLMNEPIAHYFPDKDSLNSRLQPLMKKTVEEIRKYDKNHIVILAGAQWNTNFKVYDDFSFDDNLMYSCHIYKCPPSKGSVKGFINFMEKSGTPMYMGETGENTDEWVRDFRMVLEESSIGWTFWTYKRLDTDRSFASIVLPEGWELISNYLESDRSNFAAIRENRPDQQECRNILDKYLEAVLFDNCKINASYINALGLKYDNNE